MITRIQTLQNYIFVPLICIFCLHSHSLAQIQPDSPEASSALAQFVDNFDKFEYITCEYTHLRGKVATSEDALAGKWRPRQSGELPSPSSVRTSLVIDGKNVRFEEFADDESLKTSREGDKKVTKIDNNPGLTFGGAVDFMSGAELFNGTDSLHFTPSDGNPNNGGNIVNLNGRGVPSWSQKGIQYLHIINARGPSSLEKMAATSPKPIGVLNATHRGVDCVWLTIHRPDATRFEFALDPARGHIPLCIVRYDAKSVEDKRIEVTEIQQCSKNRWFPMRIVKYFTQGRGFWIVDDYKVTKLDVDNRPSRESLMLDLPAGTDILDVEQSEPGKVTPGATLRKQERIHPEDIPRLRDVVYRKQQDPLADTAILPAKTVWWKWAIGGAGVLLVLAALIWRIRSRRNSSIQVT